VVRIALLDDYQGVAPSLADWSKLPEGSHVEAFRDHLKDEDAIAGRLAGYDVVVGMRERTPFPRSLLERLPNLKLLITTGGRNASFDVAAAKDRGVVVSGTRGLGAPTVDLTWGLILGLVRGIAKEDRSIREGGWQTTIGPGLEGKTLGIVGLGNLGSKVAAVGKALGMQLIAWSQNLTAERAEQSDARLVSKEQLFAEADVVTVHLVLSDRSRGLIGARELALMKSTGYLINTSRGPIIDEKALIETLENKRIAGAGLDVFDEEPLPANHPFRRLENTLLTPHIGYVTLDNYRAYYADVLEDILAFLAGNPVRTL